MFSTVAGVYTCGFESRFQIEAQAVLGVCSQLGFESCSRFLVLYSAWCATVHGHPFGAPWYHGSVLLRPHFAPWKSADCSNWLNMLTDLVERMNFLERHFDKIISMEMQMIWCLIKLNKFCSRFQFSTLHSILNLSHTHCYEVEYGGVYIIIIKVAKLNLLNVLR